MIDYTWVSMGAILRDYINVMYKNKEHQMLCDIADSLYGPNIDPQNFKPEYKELYDQYGEAYFDKVIDDMAAIDSQVTDDRKARELEEDYYDRVGDATYHEDYDPGEGSMEISLVDVQPYQMTSKAYKLFKESGLNLFHRGNGDGDPNSAYYLSPDDNCDECWQVGKYFCQVTDYFEKEWENDSFRKHYGDAFEYRKRFGIS